MDDASILGSDLLGSSPGAISDGALEGALPDNPGDVVPASPLDNLPSIGDLAKNGPGLLSPPSTIDSALLDPSSSLAQNFENLTPSTATSSLLKNSPTTMDFGTAVGNDFANFLPTALNAGLQEGFGALNGLVVNPAVAQANLPTQIAAASATSQIQTQQLTTLFIWGAIAFAIVALVQKA